MTKTTGLAGRDMATSFDAAAAASGVSVAPAPPARVCTGPLPPGCTESELQRKLELWSGDLAQLPGVRIVKSARRRTVAFIPAQPPWPAIYVKQERILGAWNRLRSMFQPTHAELEFRNSSALRARGVAAPRVLGFAQWKRGPAVTMTVSAIEEFSNGMAADEYFAGFSGAALDSRLERAARHLADVHAAGVDLADCHRKNLLVGDRAEGGDAQLALLDLATVRFGPVTRRRGVERIAQLMHSLAGVLGPSERRRFIEAYALQAGVPPVEIDAFARRVRQVEERVADVRDRSRDRRCLTNSTVFAVERGLFETVYRRRDFDPATIAVVLARSRELRAIARARGSDPGIVKIDRRTECYKVEAGGKAFFVKILRVQSPAHALADSVRGSRGRRAWFAGNALVRRGIATPLPLALVERRVLFPYESVQIAEWIEGATTLQEVSRDIGRWFPTIAARRAFIGRLARFVASLQLQEIDHDDLATKNILLSRDASGAESLRVIDLEAVRSLGVHLPRERLLRALMQLDDSPRSVSRTDRMRFLVEYEKCMRTRFVKMEIAEVRRRLRERFAKSGRDFGRDGPR
jgi:tRNA A-37 threonylcarbamoyl transferase component Bud32